MHFLYHVHVDVLHRLLLCIFTSKMTLSFDMHHYLMYLLKGKYDINLHIHPDFRGVQCDQKKKKVSQN